MPQLPGPSSPARAYGVPLWTHLVGCAVYQRPGIDGRPCTYILCLPRASTPRYGARLPVEDAAPLHQVGHQAVLDDVAHAVGVVHDDGGVVGGLHRQLVGAHRWVELD